MSVWYKQGVSLEIEIDLMKYLINELKNIRNDEWHIILIFNFCFVPSYLILLCIITYYFLHTVTQVLVI